MILLGSPITASEANAAGLVAELFEAGTVLDEVIKVTSRLAIMSPSALSLAKEAVCRCKSLACVESSQPAHLALFRLLEFCPLDYFD